MFNRQSFNRSGFNRTSGKSSGPSGIATLKLVASPVGAQKTIAAKGSSALNMEQESTATTVKNGASEAMLWMKGACKATRMILAKANPAKMVLKTVARQTLTGESIIDLAGIVLKPGDEIIINTCDMTIILNGQNAMKYMGTESDFFTLMSGLNTLEYTDSGDKRTVMFDVIWKDRWL